jgi:hypothetical protein
MSCEAPLSLETLTSLWAGDLPTDEAERAEEHVFACDTCDALSMQIARVYAGLQKVVPPVISRAHKDRLLTDGLHIHVTEIAEGETAHVRFSSDRDLLVHALRGDLSQVERVDVLIAVADGPVHVTMTGVPFDRERGEVLIACQRHYEARGDLIRFEVHVVEKGVPRPARQYRVHHRWS